MNENNTLAEDKIKKGYSKDNLKLIEIKGQRYVRKTWIDIERGKKASQKQILFEEIQTGNVQIKTPKIVDTYINKKNEYEIIMEYIEGYSGALLHKISSPLLAKNLRHAFSLILTRNIEGSNLKKILSTKIIKKLKIIYEQLDDVKIKNNINILIKIVSNEPFYKIPIGQCHGDLTTENIIATSHSNFYIIDFLPSFIETPIWDLTKIRQDLIYGWSTRYLKGYEKNNTKILYKYLRPHQIDIFDNKKEYIYKIFDTINIARIAPYIRDKKTSDWVRQILEGCIINLNDFHK
tara:strand:- start:767 stop:1642 length:876 start_codon:yes stop_codon:yes gene_type:complete